MPEPALILLVLLVVVLPLATLVLAIVAFVRSRRIEELSARIRRLETEREGLGEPAAEKPQAPVVAEPVVAEPVANVTPVAEVAPVAATPFAPSPAVPAAAEPGREALQWELFIGRKALGWVAVVVFLFATAFFLRYAFENQWIGPLGRVALGAVVGTVLVVAGWHRQRHGWPIFAQMLTAAGLVVLYLATYAAFGFYQLLPQQAAGIFLALLVLESAILAVLYNAPAIGVASLLGGLLIPILMHSEHDRYQALFTYLALLDLGVLGMLVFRAWIGIGSLALVGTQGLYWLWYSENYHPEKLGWALGFQAVLLAIFLAQSLLMHVLRDRRASWEDLARMALNALAAFGAAYVLLDPKYGPWLGTAALGMALLYALVARAMLAWRPRELGQLLTALAIAAGFVAAAIPIQAEAGWIALGWMAEAAALWWFGHRIQQPMLRAMATVLAGMAVVQVLAETPFEGRQPFMPIFNRYALTALGTAALLIGGVRLTRRFLQRATAEERLLAGMAALGGVVLIWLILSVECWGYFDAQAVAQSESLTNWRWLGQMSMSILWASFAAVQLAIGFWRRLAPLRWLAIALFGVTIVKVFFVDMAELAELYRILAFFVLAVVLAIAAWAYQRIRVEWESSSAGASHDSSR